MAQSIASARATLGDCEIIVVDSASLDGTQAVARAAGARVVVALGSRAVAMNTGAHLADGDALLFLHADTTLPSGAGDAIRSALADADGGAFRLRYDDERPLLELLSEFRLRFLRPVYGDQAIFSSRAVFETLGGYKPLPIMEDYDLVRRIRRTARFTILSLSVETAARRHRRYGTIPTLARIWAIQCLYHVGTPPRLLARIYPPTR